MMNADRAAAIVKDEGEIMAKTPVATVERFRIHAETSMEQMGHVLAELTRMGLQNVGYELITDIVTFKNNGPHQTFDSTGPEEIIKFIEQHPTFNISEIVTAFKAMGRTAGSAYESVRALVKRKILVGLDPGNYQRAGVKALAASKKEMTRRGGKHNVYEINNKDTILKRIKGRARFTVEELRDHFRSIKRNPKSVSPITSKLAQAKIITLIEPGTYAWGKVKSKKVANKTRAAVKKKRGAAAQASSLEQTNG